MDLERFLEEEPDIGESDEFSFEIIGPVFDQNENIVFLIAGINRLPYEMKDFSLDFSLSTPEGTFIFKDENISLSDTVNTPIETNHIVPIAIEPSLEQLNIIEDASFESDYEEFILEVHNLSYNQVK